MFYISVPHPSRTQSTLCNQQSTHVPLPPLFLAVSGRLMAVLLPPWESHDVHTHCQKCRFFMTWKTPGHLASRNGFCWTPGQSSLKTHKTGSIPGQPEHSDPYLSTEASWFVGNKCVFDQRKASPGGLLWIRGLGFTVSSDNILFIVQRTLSNQITFSPQNTANSLYFSQGDCQSAYHLF